MENKASESANLIAAESTQTLSCREAIERLFDRPAEPFFTRDGVFFDCPEELLVSKIDFVFFLQLFYYRFYPIVSMRFLKFCIFLFFFCYFNKLLILILISKVSSLQ